MKLRKALELRKGECPKKEDFNNEFDYWKAYRKWKAKNGKGVTTKKK